jgi:hypothetical protein
MANLNYNTTSITSTTNNNLIYSSDSWLSDTTISIDSDITDFFELVLAALGYDITFEDFKKMSKQQKSQLIRDIKLKTII